MKKIFLLLAFPALLSVPATAQDASESRKPEAGDVTTELNLGLFNTGVTLNNVVNQLRGRFFFSPTLAARLGFNVTSNTQKTDATPNTQEYNVTIKNSNFSISPGIEKHFAGTERLSPFVGLELDFTSYNVSELRERETGTPKKLEFINSASNGSGGGFGFGDRAFTSTGLNAVVGVDYYFARNFYAGLELGYGFAVTKQKEAELLRDGTSDLKSRNSKITSLGAYANNGIRIGFVF